MQPVQNYRIRTTLPDRINTTFVLIFDTKYINNRQKRKELYKISDT